METRALGAGVLSEGLIEEFLVERHARGRQTRLRVSSFASALAYLRGVGVIRSPEQAPVGEVDALLLRFAGYLAKERGTAITRDALERRVTKHAATAALACPTLAEKKISPHVLRHSAAMRLLNAGVDTTVIALWLGHESVATTQIYLHADLALKERALARTTPLGTTPGRYQPTETIVAFLENL
ncbi:tyrosine-type recombinase/integrase [Micromonospora sp. NPDC047762]|uniref:tyrosine-type recombinase/integrase n=1 Tax=Micromonospora sp. NPDC047762 TaxID=3364255 RepID=UPI0037110007